LQRVGHDTVEDGVLLALSYASSLPKSFSSEKIHSACGLLIRETIVRLLGAVGEWGILIEGAVSCKPKLVLKAEGAGLSCFN